MKKKINDSKKSKYIFVTLCIGCCALVILSLASDMSVGPLKYVSGYVAKGKGKAPHAWVEIKIRNRTYVYDPNFQSEYGKKGYTGYQIRYGQKGTLKYYKTK